MPFVFPALRGRMGSTEFFQANVSARDLASVAITAGELEAWAEWSVFERFQRDLDVRRVKSEIVPYLAKTKDRFFSALVVLVFESETFEFQSMTDWASPLPGALQQAGDSMGFLTIDGGKLVVLDGQHRLVALREVVTRQESLEGEYVKAIADDQLSVLFVRHESFEKTRRIFNKVNRYAKPTSISDNVVTSEDDGSAIVTRWLVEPEPPLGLSGPKPPLSQVDRSREPIVEWRSNKLESASTKLTTLNHLYQSVGVILAANGFAKFDEKNMVNRPSDEQLRKAYEICCYWWMTVLEGIPILRRSLLSPSSIPARREFRAEDSLLLRPVAQIMLFRALAHAFRRGQPLERSVSRINQISWRASDDHWIGIATYSNGRLKMRETEIRLAALYIAYLICPELHTAAEILHLQRDIGNELGVVRYELPTPTN